MPDAVLVAVAKAVAKELETASLSRAIQVERSYGDWDTELTEVNTDGIRVDVVPFTASFELLTRGLWIYLCEIDVVIRKRLTIAEQDAPTGKLLTEEIDGLLYLTQQIGEYFAPCAPSQTGRKLTDQPTAVWTPARDGSPGTDYRAWHRPDYLRENRLYIGSVRLAYRLPRTP